MKRKTLLLTLILLAAVASVVVPFRREIWVFVAYRQADVAEGSLQFFDKRASWIPGLSGFIPDQICPECFRKKHDQCSASGRPRGEVLLETDVGVKGRAYRPTSVRFKETHLEALCTDGLPDD